VLGGTAERNYYQSMIMGDGHWSIFVSRPIAAVLVAGIVALLAWPALRGLARPLTRRFTLTRRGGG